MPQGGEAWIPPGNRSPAARQGVGTRRDRNRNSDIPAKEPEGPTGAARPRPEPPWESEFRFRARRTDLGTVEAGSDAGLHFVLGHFLLGHFRFGGVAFGDLCPSFPRLPVIPAKAGIQTASEPARRQDGFPLSRE